MVGSSNFQPLFVGEESASDASHRWVSEYIVDIGFQNGLKMFIMVGNESEHRQRCLAISFYGVCEVFEILPNIGRSWNKGRVIRPKAKSLSHMAVRVRIPASRAKAR